MLTTAISKGSFQEQSPIQMTIDFSGFDGNPEQPTNAWYRVDLLGADPPLNIRTDTQISPLATSVVVLLDATDNDFYSGVGKSEHHMVTVTANKGLSDEKNEHFVYEITKIDFVTDI